MLLSPPFPWVHYCLVGMDVYHPRIVLVALRAIFSAGHIVRWNKHTGAYPENTHGTGVGHVVPGVVSGVLNVVVIGMIHQTHHCQLDREQYLENDRSRLDPVESGFPVIPRPEKRG